MVVVAGGGAFPDVRPLVLGRVAAREGEDLIKAAEDDSLADDDGVGEGDAFAFEYSSAEATSDSRRDLSEESRLAIMTESAFTAKATTKPSNSRIFCERRLYHPDTRSIEVLNQFSIFSRAFATSFPAASISVISARRASSGINRFVPSAFRNGCKGFPIAIAWGGGAGGALSLTSKVAGVAPAAPDDR